MKPRTALNSLNNRPFAPRGGIRRALLIALATAAVAAGIYGVAGWYGAPWLVEHTLAQYRRGAEGRTARVESVRFNPFTLVAELGRITLEDDQAQMAFRAAGLRVDFAARSLLERRPVVTRLDIARPDVGVPSAGVVPGLALRRIGRMRVDRLRLTDGSFVAGRRADSHAFELTGLQLSLTSFDGRAGAGATGRYALTASTPEGASLSSEGSLGADLKTADGRLQIDALPLEAIASRLGGIAGDAGLRGRLGLTGNFRVTGLQTAPAFRLEDASVELGGVVLTPSPGLTASVEQAEAVANVSLDANGPDGRIEMSPAALSIVDRSVTPPRTFAFTRAAAVVTADGSGPFSVNLAGPLVGAGDAMVAVRAPSEAPASRIVALQAARLPATMLTAYATQATGRELETGNVDIDVEYSLNGDRVTGEVHIVAREPEFAPAAPAGPDRSLDLAVALLQNTDGVIEIAVPFAGSASRTRDVAADALRARLASVTARPFDALAPLIAGDIEPLTAVPFLPGDAALGDRAQASVEALAHILAARPRLGIRLHAGYGDDDRDALARQQIRLHVLLATADPDAHSRTTPIDFGSPRVQDVLDEFAGERLATRRITEIARRFDCQGAVALLCRRAYYQAVFDALVAQEEIADATLSRLGRFRAQSIADALSELGIAGDRIDVVVSGDTAASRFGIGLPVELTAAEPDA